MARLRFEGSLPAAVLVRSILTRLPRSPTLHLVANGATQTGAAGPGSVGSQRDPRTWRECRPRMTRRLGG